MALNFGQAAILQREVRMPWKASSVMEERLCFVARLLDGETMTEVCRDFGVSRKTGCKIFDRCEGYGLEALSGGRCAMPISCRSRARA
jgi:Homeodomain-like domain